MRKAAPAILWTLGYLALVCLPLLALLLGDVPPGLGRWWDASMALGFAGLAVMGVQFGLTARFKRASAPFGIDIIYYFHRWMAVGGLGLLVGHWLILRVAAPDALTPVLPPAAPLYMTAGRVALLLFAIILVTSIWRKSLRLEYDRWRIMHTVLAVAAIALAIGHVAGVGYYTRAPWKQLLWGGYTALWIALLIYVRVVRPWRLLRSPYRVADVREEVGRAWTLTLEPVGHPGVRFSPGQFAWLSLGRSPFRAREHPFSFSSSAHAGAPLQFTIKELGDFTRTIGRTRIGQVAYVDGPHGVFTVDRHTEVSAFGFVAGGVGIAPIMSMLRTLADRGDARPIYLIYGNARWDSVLFREELDALRQRLDLRITHVLEQPHEGWQGETGRITEDIVRRVLPAAPKGIEFFLCGPRLMSETVQRTLRDLGVPIWDVHYEQFDMA